MIKKFNFRFGSALFFAVILLLNLPVLKAANEHLVIGKTGVDIKSTGSNTLAIQDQWFNYMSTNLYLWQNEFVVASSKTKVILKYADIKQQLDAADWSLTVTYNITLTKIVGNVITTDPIISNQTLTINYTTGNTSYKDIDMKLYDGFLKAKVEITNVDYIVGGAAAVHTLPGNRNLDIFFDLEQETERYYPIFSIIGSASPLVTTTGINTVTNELPIAWNYVQGAESYDVEWVLVDIGTAAYTIASPGYAIDFRNATRINTTNQNYKIPLAFPRGILIYRVRGVAVDDIDMDAGWSYNGGSLDGNTQTLPFVTSMAYRLNYDGLDPTYNWKYASTYAEEGKRKEVISYFDGSLRQQQTTTLVNSDNNAIVAETKYDFEGRAAVQMMPTPTVSTGIRFYTNFNTDFNKNDFDTDVNFNFNNPVNPTTNATGAYYSNNTGATGTDAYTPNAQGYPFVRTQYKKDGTDRVVSQSGVGTDHKAGSNHETKYYYARAPQNELDALFGNEVGNAVHYQKNMVKDANGQVSISYHDQEGRTIATALSGTVPANLLAMDLASDPITTTTDLITGVNQPVGEALVSQSSLSPTAPTLYTFNYTLNNNEFCDNTSYCVPVCKDCKYDLEIKITNDEDGSLVTGVNITSLTSVDSGGCSGTNPMVCTGLSNDGINSAVYQFNVTLDIGTYTITKTLTLNQTSLTTYYNSLVTAFTPCYNYPAFVAEPCLDCNTLCSQTYYTSIDPLPPYSTIYHDNNGAIITFAVWSQLLANCNRLCNDPSSAPGAGLTECELKLTALKADMSPGGQYFDNRNAANNFEPLPANQNAWLTTNVAPFPSTEFAAWRTAFNCTTSAAITTWPEVRANWKDCFANYLVRFHPEYCLYEFNCERKLCPKTSNTNTIELSNTYDMDMTADNATKKYFNPTELSSAAPPTPSPYNPANYVGTTDAGYSSITQSADPYFDITKNLCINDLDFEVLTCAGGSNTMTTQKVAINQMLQNYMNAGTSGTPLYMSIWYVMDDPDNIHLATISNSATTVTCMVGGVSKILPLAIVQLFKTYHGDGTSGNTGLFGGTTPAQTKYQFFASAYQGFKKLILDRYYKKFIICGRNLPLAHDPLNWSYTSAGFQIRYPETPVYDAYWANTCMNSSGIFESDPALLTALSDLTTQAGNADLSVAYQGNCAAYASNWIDQLITNCSTSINITDIAAIKDYLIRVCANNADVFHSQGSSTCLTYPYNTCSLTNIVAPNGTTYFNNFSDVIDYYKTGTCTTVIAHPSVSIIDAQVNCSYENYLNFVAIHSASPYSPPALSNSSDIAAAINAYYGLTSPNLVTYTNVDSWITEGTAASPHSLQNLLNANMPAAFLCVQNPLPAFDFNSCTCNNLNSFLLQNGFVAPYAGQETVIAAAINSTFNITTVTSGAVSGWLTACSGSTYTSTTFDNMPLPLKCYNFNTCTSANLNSFLVFESFATPYTGQETAIAAAINTAYSVTTVTSTDVSNWLTAYSSGTYSSTTFDNMPDLMKCTGSYPIPTQQPPLTQCQMDNLQAEQDYIFAHNAIQLASAQQAANTYLNAYKLACLANAANKETFTETYNLNQYYYTLYYYDQAGNLIKTVPPKGTQLLTTSTTPSLSDVTAYRAGAVGSSFRVPPHIMVTHYWYNSLQQLIKQYTPDGDYSIFYYDYLGRLVVSQNAKQAAYTTPAYSYTMYDALGRISEVAELTSSISMTSGISRDKDPATVLATNDLTAWISAGTHSQITNTYYDEALTATIAGYFGSAGQQNLRNRVASVTYTPVNGAAVYDHATHYSYDIHGNVKTLIQDNTALETPAIAGVAHAFGLKYMDYKYDLISGNVLKVSYQDRQDAQGYPQFDRFYHQYRYDADNRLTQVLTSRDNTIWEKENKYFFYKHGPLARTEIGDKTVQGIDYAYTLQGWVKGINSNILDNTKDAGHDAQLGSNLNKWFGTDGAAFTLKYFAGDYVAKNNSVNTFESNTATNTYLTAAAPSLYNGNISAMATTITDITSGNALPQITGYKYDQLNRIRNAESFTGITSNAWDNTVSGGRYAEAFHYDLNGNINEATRNNSAGNMFDQLSYKYWNKTETTPFSITIPTDASNKLAYVDDAMSACSLAVDVDDQATGNYHYDEIGNLKSDAKEYITEIKWNVYGKISEIIKDKTYKVDSCSSTELVLQDLEFKYNASGQRIEKIVKPHKSNANGLGLTNEKDWISTFYIRDAQGNVMATYNRTYEFVTGTTYTDVFKLNELDLYGSSRIGIEKATIDDVKNRTFTSSGFTSNMFNTRSYTVPTPPATYVSTYQAYSRTLGYKELEIANHLGSVITTVGDRRITVESAMSPGTLANYKANILSTTDYYSFGMQQSERTYTPANKYRYGYNNGSEKDDEIANQSGAHYTTEFREIDTRLGRMWSPDPIGGAFAWSTPYSFSFNNPIAMNDPTGLAPPKWLAKIFHPNRKHQKTTGAGIKIKLPDLKDITRSIGKGVRFLNDHVQGHERHLNTMPGGNYQSFNTKDNPIVIAQRDIGNGTDFRKMNSNIEFNTARIQTRGNVGSHVRDINSITIDYWVFKENDRINVFKNGILDRLVDGAGSAYDTRDPLPAQFRTGRLSHNSILRKPTAYTIKVNTNVLLTDPQSLWQYNVTFDVSRWTKFGESNKRHWLHEYWYGTPGGGGLEKKKDE